MMRHAATKPAWGRRCYLILVHDGQTVGGCRRNGAMVVQHCGRVIGGRTAAMVGRYHGTAHGGRDVGRPEAEHARRRQAGALLLWGRRAVG